MEVIFVDPKADFSESSSKSFDQFFFLSLFLFGHLDASVKSEPSPNGTFLGHFCWFLVAFLG